MASSGRRPGEETRALITLELWQLALIVLVLVFAAAHFALGVGVPRLGVPGLAVLFLLVVLGGLLALRDRKRKSK